MLVQGYRTQPEEPAASKPYQYAGSTAATVATAGDNATPSKITPPKISPPKTSPPKTARERAAQAAQAASNDSTAPRPKGAGYVPPKQWRPPLQMLLHQHNGRIIAIPHVDVRLHVISSTAAAGR